MPKDPKRQKAGKRARGRGGEFERRCARLLPQLLGHPYWKRTQRGDTQHRGDLVPCDEKGMERADLLDMYHIECKARSAYSIKNVREWIAATAKACKKAGNSRTQKWLLVGQPRGPVFAIDCNAHWDGNSIIRGRMIGKPSEGIQT